MTENIPTLIPRKKEEQITFARSANWLLENISSLLTSNQYRVLARGGVSTKDDKKQQLEAEAEKTLIGENTQHLVHWNNQAGCGLGQPI